MANSGGRQVIDASSVIDMEVMDGDESDYETNIGGSSLQDDPYGRKRPKEQQQQQPYMEDVQKKVTQNVASYVWQSGSQQAKSVINTYANIDLLRPYFNVEPHEVRQRLLQSLMPAKPGSQQQKVPRELYGPTMLLFTLIALLLYQMKTGGHTVQEGTLMGTAFGTCFGYWLGVSGFVWFLAYVCNAHITMLQILSLLGYALFGHCVVMGLTTIFHTTHDHMFFYIMWAIFGGLSTLRMVSVLMSRTAGQTQRLIVCGAVSVLHLCFLLYLHFAYHQMVEDLSDMMRQPGVPHPGAQLPEAHKISERSAPGRPLPQNVPTQPPAVLGDQPARPVTGGLRIMDKNGPGLQAVPTAAFGAANKAIEQAMPNKGRHQLPNAAVNVIANKMAPNMAADLAPKGVNVPAGGTNQTMGRPGVIVQAWKNEVKLS